MEKTILTKTFSREHSLFYLENWSYANNYHFSKLLGYAINIVYLAEPGNAQVISWYDTDAISRLFAWITQSAAQDPQFFDLTKKEFYRLWHTIEPYIQKRTSIKTLEELKVFRGHVVEFYLPYAIIYAWPNIPGIDERLQKMVLEIREKIQDVVNDIDDVYLEFFNREFPQYKEIANHLTAEEVFSLAENRFSEIKLQEIYKRKEGGYFLFNNELFLYPDLIGVLEKNNIELQDYKIKNRILNDESVVSGEVEANRDESGVLNGQVAYRGKVRGIVKLVLSLSDISRVENGDILVASMTMPKYLSAMKKAEAFVTDEGGITCHAAILAREMKKPCIIGTKIATKVLKDGDLVEVDAENGIVRIINDKK